jgi:CBS domain-containing protein
LKFGSVAELMTKDVVTVDEETPISDVATLMIRNQIRRVPVLRHGVLVGLVSRPDMIRYALETPLAEQLV